MKQRERGRKRLWLRARRLLTGLLCAAMLCGLLPSGLSLTESAQAATAPLAWSNADLEKLYSLRIMRGDSGGLRPNDTITRAEFATMVNRALGYTEKAASIPFSDVRAKDWFANDISISYQMGYMKGTSKSKASPNGTLTREEALVIIARNLMLQPSSAESFSFADSRTFNSWSRGYVDPAIEAGLIDASPRSNLDPGKAITRGEVAGLISRAIGTLVKTAGTTSLRTVNGNVTINRSNVTLRNTTINGDLFLTAGIGLGEVLLDNVTVNGTILVSGAGVSEKGNNSVILRDVEADELLVDNMRKREVSLRAEGYTSIPHMTVRTPVYMEDSTSDAYGVHLIEILGSKKPAVRLSGNIKEVHNKAPNSALSIGEGVADTITVDELAKQSTVDLGKGARVKKLNLDSGIKVTGSGYIDSLTVGANGATVDQMPNEIVIQPGITATVGKVKMDTAAAAEYSSRPRLLSGYPVINDITPNTATLLLRANKPGTVYWAVTALTDGSPSEEDVISPPSYSKIIVRSGSVRIKESNKDQTVKISGLSSDCPYYLTTVMVDERGTTSTLKVAAFTTPDNSVPAFATGYPAPFEITEQDAQFAVMTTKNCYLYYVVLPKGSSAPRAADFKSGKLGSNLGFGTVKMAKNNPTYIFVNDIPLEEKQSYVLYLWLTDFDGAKSSTVKAVNFTTEDRTPPIVSNVRSTGAKATSATVGFTINEAATLYWAVVPTGDKTFTTPDPGFNNKTWPSSKEAKERVASGIGAIKSGKASVNATKAGKDASFTVSGLNSKTTGTSTYDLYYVAQDTAGNWSDVIQCCPVYTEDKTNPTVEQKFTGFDDGDTEDTTRPWANTDIKLVFSKQVGASDDEGVFRSFLDLYREDRAALTDVLRETIRFYKVPTGGGAAQPAVERSSTSGDWDIDYSNARVYLEGTSMVVEFPNDTADTSKSALQLANGRTYYFVVSPKRGDIRDTTANHNMMDPKTLPRFTTMPAQVNIGEAQDVGGTITVGGDELAADFKFQLEPRSTSTAPKDSYYDLMIWCNRTLQFDLYTRSKKTGDDDWGNWSKVNTGAKAVFDYTGTSNGSMYRTVAGVNGDTTYKDKTLQSLKEDTVYQYAVHITAIGDNNDKRETWNIDPEFRVTVASGSVSQLGRLANRKSESDWSTILNDKNSNVESIGSPKPYFARTISISDTVPPILDGDYPIFTDVLDHSATMQFQLNNPGTIYYVVTPAIVGADGNVSIAVPGSLASGKTMNPEAKGTSGETDPAKRGYYADDVPQSGGQVKNHNTNETGSDEAILNSPGREVIISRPVSDPTARQGSVDYSSSTARVELDDLLADTWYYVYLMFEGNRTSEKAVCYKFKTAPPIRPTLNLSVTPNDRKTGSVTASMYASSGSVTARLIPKSDLPSSIFSLPFNMKAGDTTDSGRANPLGFDFLNAEGKKIATTLASLTILDAMSRSVGSTGTASYFDTYASPELQAYIATGIRSGTVGGVAKWPDASAPQLIRKDQNATMNFTLPNPNVTYFCVAVAENTTPGADHGFSAHDNVQIVDDIEPEASNYSGGLTLVETMVENGSTRTYTYRIQGTLTIQYANFLYRYDYGRAEALPFTQAGQPDVNNKPTPLGVFEGKDASGDATGSWWYGVSGLYTDPGVTVVTSGGTPQLTREFTITVDISAGGNQTVTKKVEYLTDKNGQVITDKDGNPIQIETWPEPVKPTPTGRIGLPTDFVNRSNLPAKVKKNIEYTVDRNGNVKVSLK